MSQYIRLAQLSAIGDDEEKYVGKREVEDISISDVSDREYTGQRTETDTITIGEDIRKGIGKRLFDFVNFIY